MQDIVLFLHVVEESLKTLEWKAEGVNNWIAISRDVSGKSV